MLKGDYKMPKCKYCNKDIEMTLSGLRDFCSDGCRKAHRLAYKANWMKEKRCVDNRGGYIGMDSQNVDKTNPYQKPIRKGQNGSPGLPEDKFEPFGGKSWHDLAKKHCCNFEVKKDKGDYCITLAEPYKAFKVKCSKCELMYDIQANLERKNLMSRHCRKGREGVRMAYTRKIENQDPEQCIPVLADLRFAEIVKR